MDTPKTPTCIEDLADQILHYGNFGISLKFLTNFLESTKSSSLIIRGNTGSGKKTLVDEALAACPKVVPIHLNPFQQTEDFAAMRYIASKLKLSEKNTLQELINAIQGSGKTSSKKIVIILHYFEEFCRKKQTLLYTLTSLCQSRANFAIVGLTISLDPTENIEKRVRSRLNAHFHQLLLPYNNKTEYVEFASLLLGGRKITGNLEEQLHIMYQTTNRSIRLLKQYLVMKICKFDPKGRLSVEQPEVVMKAHPFVRLNDLADRFGWLTRDQLDLVKFAVYYCFKESCRDFTLTDLSSRAEKLNYTKFDTTSPKALRDIALLVRLKIWKPVKDDHMITRASVFTTSVGASDLRQVMLANKEYHHTTTDNLWKNLK